MADVARLIAELKAEGELDSEGAFSLDREKAREKMQKFQLADPLGYLLLLVQAARLKGAELVDFEVDSNDVHVCFDGAPFVAADFEHLYGALFSEGGAPELQARRELALAINAAMALEPRRLVVESFGGDQGARLVVEPGEADDYEALHEPPPRLAAVSSALGERTTTHVHVRDRFRAGVFVSFFKNLAGSLAEEKLIRERLRFAPFEIVLEGTRVSGGPVLDGRPDVVAAAELTAGPDASEPGIVGQVVVSRRLEPARVHLVRHGVWLTTHTQLEHLPQGLEAVVCCDAFKKDVSQENVVQDEVYARALKAVASARSELLASMVARFEGEDGEAEDRQWLRRYLQLLCTSEAPERLRKREGEVAAALAGVKLWPTNAQGPVSLAAVLEATPAHGLPWTRTPYEGVKLQGPPFVLLIDSDEQQLMFEALAEGRAYDAAPELERARERERKRQLWRMRKSDARLPAGRFLARAPLSGEGLRGELGLREVLADRSHFAWVTEGCLLGETRVQLQRLQGLEVIVEADLEPNWEFDGPKRNLPLAEVVERVLLQLPALLPALAQRAGAGASVLHLLDALLAPELRRQVAEALELPKVDPSPLARAAPILETVKAGAVEPGAPPPEALRVIWSKPILFGVDGGVHSLEAVTRAAAAFDGIIRLVARERWSVDHPKIDRFMLAAGPVERRVLTALFGAERLRDADDLYASLRAAAAHKKKPQEELRLPRALASERFVTADGKHEGVVGLARSEDAGLAAPERVQLRVLVERRFLANGKVNFPVAGLESVVDAPTSVASAQWDNVVFNDDFKRVVEALRGGARRLIRSLAAATPEGEEVDALLLGALRALIPGRGFARALAELMDREPAARNAAYRRLLERAESQSPKSLDKALWKSLKHKGARIEDALRSLPLAAEPTAGASADGLHGYDPESGALMPFDALLDAPLFLRAMPRFSKARISLREVLAAWKTEHRRVPYLDEPADVAALNERTVLLAVGAQAAALRDLFGDQAMLNLAGWIEQEHARRAFLERPRVPVELSPVDALIALPFEAEGVSGEVGLALVPEGDDASQVLERASMLALHCQERHVETLRRGPKGLVAALNADEMPMSPELDRVSDAGYVKQLARLVKDTKDRLAAALAERAPALWEAHPERRWAIRLQGLSWLADKVGRRPEMSTADPEVVAALEETVGFERADGELVRMTEIRRLDSLGRTIETVPRGLAARLPEPLERPSDLATLVEGPLLQTSPVEDRLLEALVKRTRVASKRFEHLLEVHERHHRLPPAPTCPEGAALLADAKVTAVGFSSHLWLPLSPPSSGLQVAVARHGREITRISGSRWFPVAGVAQGAGMQPNDDWSDVKVSKHKAALVEDGARLVYERLIERLDKLLGPEARQQAREYLKASAMALHETFENDKDGLKSASIALYRRLWGELRLLDHPRWRTFAAVVAAGRKPRAVARWAIREARFYQAPAQPLELPRAERFVAGPVPLAWEGGRGVAGVSQRLLRAWGAAGGEPQLELELRRDGRLLALVSLPSPVGPFEAIVDDPSLLPTPDWDDVEPGPELDRALDAVMKAGRALAERMRPFHADEASQAWLLAAAQAMHPEPLSEEGLEACGALAELPLVPAAGRAMAASLTDLGRALAQGELLVAAPDGPPIHVDFTPERLVLTPTPTQHERLLALVDEARVGDGRAWLEEAIRQRRFEARGRREVALRPGAALVVERIETSDGEGGPVGEIGLAAGYDIERGGSSVLKLFKDRRPADEVRSAFEQALIAAVNYDALALTEDLAGVEKDAAYKRVVTLCRLKKDALHLALLSRWDQLRSADRKAATGHLLDWLAQMGGVKRRLKSMTPEQRALVEQTPFLPAADGRWHTLAQAWKSVEAYGALYVLSVFPAGGGSAVDPDKVVVVARTTARKRLEQVCRAVEDYTEGWADEQIAHRNRARLVEVPAEMAQVPTLVEETLGPDGPVRGLVFLPVEPITDGRVLLVGDGLVVGSAVASETVPIEGVVEGRGVEISRRWDDAALSEVARAALQRTALRLYRRLAEAYREGEVSERARGLLLRVVERTLAGETGRAVPPAVAALVRGPLWTLPILWAHGDGRATLEEARAHKLASPEALALAERFERLPVEAPETYTRHLDWQAEVVAPGVSGWLGYAAGRRQSELRLLKGGRPLEQGSLGLPVEPLSGAVEAPLVWPRPDWQGAAEGEALEVVRGALWRALGEVLVRAATVDVRREEAAALVRSALRVVFPTPRFGQAWLKLVAQREGDEREAAADWAAIMRVGKARSVRRVHKALGKLLEGGDAISEASVRRHASYARGDEEERLWPLPGDDWQGDARPPEELADVMLALLNAPVIPTCFGGAPVSATTLLQAEGPVGFLTITPTLTPEAERLVVDARLKSVRALVGALLGSRAEDAAPWLAREGHRQEFMLRPRREVSLKLDHVLVRVPIRGEGLSGEVGLPVVHTGDEARATARLHLDGRFVASKVGFSEVPLVAAVDAVDLPVTPDFRGLEEGPALERILEQVRATVPDVLHALVRAWPSMSSVEQPGAFRHLIGYLAEELGGAEGARWERPLVAELAGIQGFEGVDGERYSLAQLREAYEAQGEVGYVSYKPAFVVEATPERPTIVARAWMQQRLARVLPKLVDRSIEIQDAGVAAVRRRNARPLPQPDPASLLVSVAVEAQGLDGLLWLPRAPGSLEVAIGRDGLEAERRALDLPVAGRIAGQGVKVGKRWDGVQLTTAQLALLDQRAEALYRQLAERLKSHAFDSEETQRTARGYLRRLALSVQRRIAEEEEARRDRAQKKKRQGEVPPVRARVRALHREVLTTLPLLELPDGRAMSLSVALTEHPPELAHLGLWDEGTVRSGAPGAPGASGDGEAKAESGEDPWAPLLEALRAELRAVRAKNAHVLSALHLDRIGVAPGVDGAALVRCDDEGIRLYGANPVVEAARAGLGEDPVPITVLASTVFTALNAWLEEVEDVDEDTFHTLLAAHAGSGLAPPALDLEGEG